MIIIMASKQRVSLRRKQKAKNDGKPISENEDDADAFEMKSPSRQVKDDTGPSKKFMSPTGPSKKFMSPTGPSKKFMSPTGPSKQFPSASFRSPVLTASTPCRSKHSPGSADTSLDDSLERGSQVPTPSKWNYLLPDFNSQPDDVVSEVLWDCASPDAVKYLRRVQKDNNNIKELIKFVKEPTGDSRSKSPQFQLQLLRASLQKHLMKKKKPPDAEKKKQRRLAQLRKRKVEDKKREKQLFGQMLSAVAKREALEAMQKEENQSEASTSKLDTATTSTETEEEEDDDEEGWEDDDLFENNSFIIAATQNPYEFLKENVTKTSTPVLAAGQRKEGCELKNHDHCGCVGEKTCIEDSQNLEVIPPTYVTRRSLKSTAKPRILFSKFAAEEKEEDSKTVIGAENEETIVGPQEKDCGQGCSTVASSAEKMKPPNSSTFLSKHPPASKSAFLFGESEQNFSSARNLPKGREIPSKTGDVCETVHTNPSRTTFCADLRPDASSVKREPTDASSSCDVVSDGMSDDGVSDELFLKVPQHSDTFQSQIIQEYPTQAKTKLCDRATLVSAKPGSSHREDFPDDIDLEALASICENDSSFSDSPVRVKTNNYPGKSVASDRNEDRNPGPSDNKQLKLQGGAKTTCVKTSAENSANCGKAFNQRSVFVVSTKVTANTGAQKSIHAWSASIGIESSKPQHPKSVTNSGLVFPPFAEKTKPLSSVVVGNTVTEKPGQSRRKFTFKPLSSSSSSSSASSCGQLSQSDSRFGATSAIGKPSRNAGANVKAGSLDVSCSQLKLDSGEADEDMMDDDPLYESQIMAILDQVESQAAQQMTPQSCGIQEISSTPPQCSQEEIEKKRQAAVQRRQLRSKSRLK